MKTYQGNGGMVVKLNDDQSKLFDYIVKVHQSGGAQNKYQIASALQWTEAKVDTIAAELVAKGMIGAHKP